MFNYGDEIWNLLSFCRPDVSLSTIPTCTEALLTVAEKDEIWNAIKTIPTWRFDIVADIQVTGQPSPTASPGQPAVPVARTYTVKIGDTLGHIAKLHLGSAGAFMDIFELNRDQLTDPDKIKPGQVLHLP